MWITSTNFPYYRPKTGQRIIANYSIVSVNTENDAYNHKVVLNDVYEVLTKGIFKIKPATQDSIGNDQIDVRGHVDWEQLPERGIYLPGIQQNSFYQPCF